MKTTVHATNYDSLITKNIIIHGFINDKDGKKMSKSVGNIIDVDYLMNKYSIDAIRYYLLSNTRMPEDINFNEEILIDCYNNELLKNFGNLIQRVYKLVIPIQDIINTKITVVFTWI